MNRERKHKWKMSIKDNKMFKILQIKKIGLKNH